MTRNLIKENPIIKILVSYLVGILFAEYTDMAILILVCFTIVFFIISLVNRKLIFISRLWKSGVIYSLFALIAAFNFNIHRSIIPKVDDKTEILILQLEQTPQEKNKSYQCLFLIAQSNNDSLCGTKLIAYTTKDSLVKDFKVGDKFVASVKIREIPHPTEKTQFDYKNYMASQGIYYQTYIPLYKLQQIENKSLAFKYKIERFRQELLERLRNVVSTENFQVLSALSLGYRDELEINTRSYFQQAGIMHILAVSGLHVGIIFGVFSVLFAILKRKQIFIYVLLMLSVIWTYAMLTGFSPSVQRASVMLSFIILAEALNRKGAIASSIAASALFLLAWNPNIIFNLGFQLSYVAVISIIVFQPKLSAIYKPQIKLTNFIWGIITVSIAAQVGTLPLTIYYFHQFPNYFIISNIFAIPLATILLVGSLLFFCVSEFKILSLLIGVGLDYLSSLFIIMLKFVSSLPYSLSSNLYINEWQLLSLSIAIIFLGIYLYYKNGKLLLLILFCILMFVLSFYF